MGDAMGDTFIKLLFINTLGVLKVEPGGVSTPPMIPGPSELDPSMSPIVSPI